MGSKRLGIFWMFLGFLVALPLKVAWKLHEKYPKNQSLKAMILFLIVFSKRSALFRHQSLLIVWSYDLATAATHKNNPRMPFKVSYILDIREASKAP